MLLLTFEQTFTGGVLYDGGGAGGAGGGSSEKNDFISEAHLLAALVCSSCGSFSLAILSSSDEESSQKASWCASVSLKAEHCPCHCLNLSKHLLYSVHQL